jgi:stearoyl-CoA desaturase (Delta-9 desaturase)
VYHVTFCVNSVTHIVGRKRFRTKDESRNNWLVAMLTMGEGWHNNHHRYPASARQGMYWWEIDASYYVLRVLERLGVVWDLRKYPAKMFEEALELKDEMRAEMKRAKV